MQLRDWRKQRKMSAAETARSLGIAGVNPGGTIARIEVGSRRPDADMVQRIHDLTGGLVSALDMHETRLAWLRQNRPDRFFSVQAAISMEAAE
ncbi:helix-turn-helix transcriptional regulator [Nitratireductor sp. GZWM139]|uniref:helix-turn-helix domain-containing protein n=1 Tax=Nitratireductor sp. GZWM139 TaxID=2950541 RepID=UPI0024BD6423|nr:helix-turn-helix transcriptional regulator [Nitratireductor sp. GZWM139]